MEVKLPKLGEGAESGTVVGVLVKEGDAIAKGQTILELENEKAVAPIPSPMSGTVISIRVKDGDQVSVGQVLLTLREKAETAGKEVVPRGPAARVEEKGAEAEVEESTVPPAKPKSEEAEPARSGMAPAASPSLRRIARELGLDLARIRGSERGGRIVMADLRAYIQRLQKLTAEPKAGAASKPPPSPTEQVDFSTWGPIARKPISPLRKIIIQRMTENWTTIPHVTQFDEADITVLTDLRKKYVLAYEQKGARLTLTSFALKAVAATLKKHPAFNSTLDDAAQEIILKEYVHLGLAVDTAQGLIVPVIREVDKKNMLDLSKEVTDLAEKARNRKISLEELKGGTFTISNQGGIGGAHFTPIINKPEVAILGLGRGAMKPIVRGQKIEARLLLPLALSYDHRVVDGADAARFMVDLVHALENFPEEQVKV